MRRVGCDTPEEGPHPLRSLKLLSASLSPPQPLPSRELPQPLFKATEQPLKDLVEETSSKPRGLADPARNAKSGGVIPLRGAAAIKYCDSRELVTEAGGQIIFRHS